MSTTYIADHGSGEVAIYAETGADQPRGAARYRLPDHGDVDALLRAHGWRRVGPWVRSDDMPAGHRGAVVEPLPGATSIAMLERDQQLGDQRRAGS